MGNTLWKKYHKCHWTQETEASSTVFTGNESLVIQFQRQMLWSSTLLITKVILVGLDMCRSILRNWTSKCGWALKSSPVYLDTSVSIPWRFLLDLLDIVISFKILPTKIVCCVRHCFLTQFSCMWKTAWVNGGCSRAQASFQWVQSQRKNLQICSFLGVNPFDVFKADLCFYEVYKSFDGPPSP